MNYYRLSKWQIILVVVAVFFIQVNQLWANTDSAPEKVVIGYMTVPNPLIIAKQLRLFEETINVPVEWVKFESGRHVLEAFEKKEVDLAHIGSAPCAAGIATGQPIEVIWVSAIIADGEALIVKRNAGIEKVNDLVGKKVATPFGSTAHYALKVFLKLSGVDESTLEIVNLDPRQMEIAWEENEIHAGYVWEPTLSNMMTNGGKILVSSRELAIRGFPTADLFVSRKDFSESHSDIVTMLVDNLNRATELTRKDPIKAADAIAKELSTTPQQAMKDMGGMIYLTAAEQKVGRYIGNLQWNFGLYSLLKDTADFLQEEGVIKKSLPWPVFNRSINSGYIEDLYRRLKIPE